MGKIIQKNVLNGELGKIWEFITEPDNFPKYVYGYSSGKTLSKNKTGIGARYEWYGKPFRLKSVEEIVEWKNRRKGQKYVAYTGEMFGIKFNSSMRVIALGKKSLLTVSIEYHVPIYLGGALLDNLLVKWVVKDYVNQSLFQLKRSFP